MASAPVKSASGCVVRSAMTRAPAARPAAIPGRASSKTTHVAASSLRRLAPSWYPAGAGFPCDTSSLVTTTGGIGRPTELNRSRAKSRPHDVTTAQVPASRLARNRRTPATSSSPSTSASSAPSSHATSRMTSRWGATVWTVSRERRPWAIRNTFSGSRPWRWAHWRHTRSTTARESTSTPSRSKRNAAAWSSILLNLVTMTEAGGARRYGLGALAHRNYRLFFIGQGVSLVGTWMTQVATGWLVFRLTGVDAPFWLGVVGFAGQVPTFFLAPPAGVLVDRWNRHRVLVVTQVLSL